MASTSPANADAHCPHVLGEIGNPCGVTPAQKFCADYATTCPDSKEYFMNPTDCEAVFNSLPAGANNGAAAAGDRSQSCLVCEYTNCLFPYLTLFECCTCLGSSMIILVVRFNLLFGFPNKLPVFVGFFFFFVFFFSFLCVCVCVILPSSS